MRLRFRTRDLKAVYFIPERQQNFQGMNKKENSLALNQSPPDLESCPQPLKPDHHCLFQRIVVVVVIPVVDEAIATTLPLLFVSKRVADSVIVVVTAVVTVIVTIVITFAVITLSVVTVIITVVVTVGVTITIPVVITVAVTVVVTVVVTVNTFVVVVATRCLFSIGHK